jgi:uncharacterized membrane protein
MAEKNSTASKKATFGLDENIASMLCYVAGWATGIVFLLAEKENQTVRYHAMQSLIAFGVLTVIPFVPIVGWILSPFMAIVGFVTWVICVYKAYQGEKFKLPVVGELAEKQLKKMK